jgi:NAD(P)-dependent dehydrogenase (short-subunit alcohol dehydrogenase family)
VVFDDLDFRFRDYDPWAAYGQSKTANVLFAVGATARWADAGIFANALMPGGIATNLQRHLEPGYMQRVRGNANLPIKTVEQGAATSVLVATAPELEGVGGRYFEDCNEAPVVGERGGLGARGVAPYALDPDNADRLWEVSSRLVNA